MVEAPKGDFIYHEDACREVEEAEAKFEYVMDYFQLNPTHVEREVRPYMAQKKDLKAALEILKQLPDSAFNRRLYDRRATLLAKYQKREE